MENSALESSLALIGGPHLRWNQRAREHKCLQRARARECDVALQSVGVDLTPDTAALEPLPLVSPLSASVLVLLPIASGDFNQPPPKQVQVFIAPSLEPPLITSLPDIAPLS